MHNIYDVNRSVAGHFIEINSDYITINKSDNSFTLPVSSNYISHYVDTADVVFDKNLAKCKLAGWAYQNRNTAPAKSIYVAYKGKLISRSVPTRRIDVRVAMDLTYDHCGFECNFSLTNFSKIAESFSLIIVGEDSVNVEHIKIINPTEQRKLASVPIVMDKSVTLTTTPSFEYSLDSVEIINDQLVLKGWCFLRTDPNADIYISFLKSGIALGPLCLQTKQRADVGALHNLDGHHFYGFEFKSHCLSDLPINPSDISLYVLLAAPNLKIKELIRLIGD
jgi:hypothetical protein